MLSREQLANKLFLSEKHHLLEARTDFDSLPQPEKDIYLAEADYWLTKPEGEWPLVSVITSTRKNAPKLSEEDRETCRKLFSTKEKSITELAKMFGVANSSMHSLLVPRTKAQRELKRSNDRIRSRVGGKTCFDCPKQIVKNASRCNSCAKLKSKERAVKFPDMDVLRKMVAESSLSETARLLRCSRNAIQKKIAREEGTEKAA